jgi:hypothetical protein
MAIVRRGKNKYLVRIYKGRDPVTKKRIEFNKTVLGKAAAKKLETKLKGIAKSGKLAKSSRMTLNALLDHYLDTHRHRHVENTQNKNKKCFSSQYRTKNDL